MPQDLIETSTFSAPVTKPEPVVDRGVWFPIADAALQALTNRTRFLLNGLEALTGATGSIGNITDVDDADKSNGFVLSYNSATELWEAVPLESGVLALRSGSGLLDELLATNQRTFEGGTTGWTAGANATITQSATQARTGANSLRLESGAAGDMSASTLTGASGYPVTAESSYTVTIYSRAQSTGRDATVGLAFYDAAGTLIGTIAEGAAAANNNSGWTQHTLQATAPALAVTAAVIATVKATGAAGEQVYFDDATTQPVIVSRQKINLRGAVIDTPASNSVTYYPGGGRIKQVAADYTVQQNDDGATLEIDATAAARAITLLNGVAAETSINLLKTAGGNDVTVTAEGTLVGAAGTISGVYSGLRVYKRDATTWVALPFSGGSVGSIVQAATAPTDGTWLATDGGVYLQATYAALYEKIGLIFDGLGADVATTPANALSGGDSGASIKDRAFDNNPSFFWISQQFGAAIIDTAWIGYDLGAAVGIMQVRIQNLGVSRIPSSFDIQFADDAAFTTNVITFSVTPISEADNAWNDYNVFANQRYFRAIARAQTGAAGNWGVREIELLPGVYTYNDATEFVTPNITGANMFIKAAN